MAKLKELKDPSKVTAFLHGNEGRPVLLGDFDQEVAQYIPALRQAGGCVSTSIVMAAAKGILTHKKSSLPRENGDKITLTKDWAGSFLKRHRFVKRKATKAARKLPENFDEQRTSFLDRIDDLVQERAISADLIMNWDQSGTKVVPVNSWTLDERRSMRFSVVGKVGKREITILLCCFHVRHPSASTVDLCRKDQCLSSQSYFS